MHVKQSPKYWVSDISVPDQEVEVVETPLGEVLLREVRVHEVQVHEVQVQDQPVLVAMADQMVEVLVVQMVLEIPMKQM